MPDNTTLNAGTGGDVIASDDIGGVKYQRVKVAFGADGSATDASPTNPLPAAVYSRTSKVAVTPTVTSASAYAAGNAVGGKMTFAGVFDSANSGILQSIRVRSKSIQTTGLKLYLFTSDPTNTTWTDKTAPSVNVADLPNLVGPFTLGSPDSGLGTETTWTLEGIGAAIVASGTGLFGILVATGTPTWASTTDVTVELTTLKD